MASTREIRSRIKSVKATAQITKAMQLVAAAKMRKAQEAALGGKQYSMVMARVLASLSGNINPSMHRLLQENSEGETAVLFLSSDRGLAGAYNTNLFKETGTLPLEATYITVGKKGREYIVKTKKNLNADFEHFERVTFNQAKQLARILLDDFYANKIDKAFILYTDFINTLHQKPKVVQLLPITREEFQTVATSLKIKEQVTVEAREYLFEPKADQLLDFVLKHYVEMTVYQAMLEASASEHSARMIAMKNATDNALELVGDLTLTYNQARQAGITTELLEITTAAIALE